MRVSGLQAAVALARPPSATWSNAKQSVRTLGGEGQNERAIWRAQATAAAAVQHQQGGQPCPYAVSCCVSETIAIAKPAAWELIHSPSSIDPSRYHEQFSMTSGGSRSIKKPAEQLHSHRGRSGMQSTNSALVWSNRLWSEFSLSRASPACFGASGHPSAGRVAEQLNLCCRVPTSWWQTWQVLSWIFQRWTAAFWPGATASH